MVLGKEYENEIIKQQATIAKVYFNVYKNVWKILY